MIEKKLHLTCNQAMVLLDIYRGTYIEDRHMATANVDLEKLIRNGYVTTGPLRILYRGEERVKEMLG